MKTIVVALACLAIATAVEAAPPAAASQEAQVLRFDSDVQPESYKFA